MASNLYLNFIRYISHCVVPGHYCNICQLFQNKSLSCWCTTYNKKSKIENNVDSYMKLSFPVNTFKIPYQETLENRLRNPRKTETLYLQHLFPTPLSARSTKLFWYQLLESECTAKKNPLFKIIIHNDAVGWLDEFWRYFNFQQMLVTYVSGCINVFSPLICVWNCDQ